MKKKHGLMFYFYPMDWNSLDVLITNHVTLSWPNEPHTIKVIVMDYVWF